jgi:hypothetical protein
VSLGDAIDVGSAAWRADVRQQNSDNTSAQRRDVLGENRHEASSLITLIGEYSARILGAHIASTGHRKTSPLPIERMAHCWATPMVVYKCSVSGRVNSFSQAQSSLYVAVTVIVKKALSSNHALVPTAETRTE